MSPEEEIIFNILNSTLQNNFESLISKSSQKEFSPIVNKKNKLTASVQNELSKYCPYILPIINISESDDLCTCYEGLKYEDFKNNIKPIEELINSGNPGSGPGKKFPFKLYWIEKSYYPHKIQYDLQNSSSIILNDEYQLFISFINTPEFMINYVVYPKEKINTQSLYMYGIYLQSKILPDAGSESKNIIEYIIDGVFQDTLKSVKTFEELMDNLILSEYPSFENFYKSINIKGEYSNQMIQGNVANTFDLSSIKSKVLKTYLAQDETLLNIEHKNTITQKVSLKEFSEYDFTLLNMYIEILSDPKSEIREIESYYNNLTDNYYMFPVLKSVYKFIDFNDEKFTKFLNLHRLSYNLKIFLKIINSIGFNTEIETSIIETVDRFYYTNKIIFKFLKPFYFNYIALKLCTKDNEKYNYFSYIPSQYQTVKKYENYMTNIVPTILVQLNNKIKLDNINIYNIIGKSLTDTFYPTYSLMQMKFVESFNQQDLVSLLLKLIFFNKNTKYNKPVVLATVKGMSENDIDIYKQFLQLYKKSSRQEPTGTGTLITETSKDEFDRGKFRVDELNSFKFFTVFNRYRGSDEHSSLVDNLSFKYLDYGGGIGDITNSIAKYLGLLKKNVFVTDIKDWFGNEIVEKYKNNITYRYLKSNILPFEDNSFDFITAFQVLHHVPDVDKALKELWRVSKKDAIVLIREHDCNSNSVRALIDIEHAVFELVRDPVENNSEPDYTYLQNYSDSMKYMSKNELTIKM